MIVAFLFGNGELQHLLHLYGYYAVFVLVMVESLGIPVPGETILIAAALYAGATGHLDVWIVIAAAAAGAIVGDNIGFGVGHWGGVALLRRFGDKLHIGTERLKIGRYVFLRHGGKVVFFGRFVSVLRTYAAFLAGTNRMSWPSFLAFNASGGIVWAAIYGLGYFYFGHALHGLQTPVDVGLGVAAAAILVGGLVLLKRKEQAYARRADEAIGDDPLGDLG